MKELDSPPPLLRAAFSGDAFEQRVETLADKAFEDQCTTANPKDAPVQRTEEIYGRGYTPELINTKQRDGPSDLETQRDRPLLGNNFIFILLLKRLPSNKL